MKILSIMLSVLIFSSTLFSYTCYFHQYSDDIRLGHINGRKIHTLFTPHLGNHREQVEGVIKASNDIPSELNILLIMYQRAIKSEQSEAQQLIQLLASDQIDWIGIELSREEMKGLTYNEIAQPYLTMKRSFNNLNNRPRWNQVKTNQILSLMYRSYIIAYTENPELFEEAKFIPLEDPNLREIARSLSEDKNMALSTLAQLEKEGLISHWKYLAIGTLAERALEQRGLAQITGDNLISSSELKNFLQAQEIEQTEVIEAVTSYVNTINDFMINGKNRDEAVARSVNNQSGNGIILMGDAHKAGVEDELIQSCLEQNRNHRNIEAQ